MGDTPLVGLTMDMVDIGATDPMEDGPTMVRGLQMLSPLPRLMLSLLPRLMLIPSMIMVDNGATMDTILDPMAGHTMDMVDNGVTDPMEECSTMARGLLMLSPLPRLMLIPSMIMDTTLDTIACLPLDTVDNGATTLDTVATHTIAMVETMDMATEDNGGKITHYYRSLLGHRQPQEKTR